MLHFENRLQTELLWFFLQQRCFQLTVDDEQLCTSGVIYFSLCLSVCFCMFCVYVCILSVCRCLLKGCPRNKSSGISSVKVSYSCCVTRACVFMLTCLHAILQTFCIIITQRSYKQHLRPPPGLHFVWSNKQREHVGHAVLLLLARSVIFKSKFKTQYLNSWIMLKSSSARLVCTFDLLQTKTQ